MDENANVPLILCRPVLATSKAMVDVNDGKLVLSVGDDEVVFKLLKAMKHPLEFDDALYSVDSPNLDIYNCV